MGNKQELTSTNEEISKLNKNRVKEKNLYSFIKPVLDFVVTILFSPIILAIIIIFAIIVRLDSSGSPFYTQTRSGKNGKEFKIYKLRSMYTDAEMATGMVWAEVNDPRITRVGKFIRKVRIDELPQFLNVIKGDMSIIGPRPERPELIEEFEKTFPGFKERLEVRPGITGLAQVTGGYDNKPNEKLVYDLEYIDTLSFWTDIKIVVKTLGVLVTGEGAR
ncbi:sugar transferase [Erysipelothrix anatis]|uniref:sugar transferase n=1 Tax=Erysipelothrix anatis TaxID=2683713 RepID=UPI0013574D88|nr:sugar transferase [Erysipelothrix anatis]